MHVIALTTTPVMDSYQLDTVLRYIYEPENLPEVLRPDNVALMEKRINVGELVVGNATRVAQVFTDLHDPIDRLMVIVPQTDLKYLSVLHDCLGDVDDADDLTEDQELLVTFVGNLMDLLGAGFSAAAHEHVGVLELTFRDVGVDQLKTIVSEYLS